MDKWFFIISFEGWIPNIHLKNIKIGKSYFKTYHSLDFGYTELAKPRIKFTHSVEL